MILYHGTSSSFIQDILDKGLRPRYDKNGNWKSQGKVKSHQDFIYLTNNLVTAEFYAMRSVVVNNCSQGVVLIIDDSKLNEQYFYPDENLFTTPDDDGMITGNDMNLAKEQIRDNQK